MPSSSTIPARHGAIACAVAFAAEPLESRVLLSTSYYFSPNGDDNADGHSPATAWKSVTKINALDLDPGDKVLFEGGQTFADVSDSNASITNAGFEAGNTSGWNVESVNNAVQSSTTHSGNFALKVTTPTGTGEGGVVQDITSSLTPGAAYTFRAWLNSTTVTSSLDHSFVGVHFKKNGVVVSAVDLVADNADFWHEINTPFVAPASFDYAEVYAVKSNGPKIMYVDDISIRSNPNTITMDAADSGTAANPVIFDSYGTGRATIEAGDGDAMEFNNTAGVEVHDLNLVGTWDATSGTGNNRGSGIDFVNNQLNNTKLAYIRVDNVTASGFGRNGISVRGANVNSGFSDVRITNTVAHDNGNGGIIIVGPPQPDTTAFSHTNVYVGNSLAYNNTGLGKQPDNSGNGILLSDVNGGKIEHSVAYNNGQFNNNTTGGGPFGIWTYDANLITIQYNESYGNKTGNRIDGGGFDMDGGTTASVIQYNYSHGNMGTGLHTYQFPGARGWNHNTIRYNVSENDSRGGNYSGIYLGASTGNGLDVYNNTIYMTPFAGSNLAAIKIKNVKGAVNIRNNIFQTTGGVRVLESSITTVATVLLQGNDYWSSGDAFNLFWPDTLYGDLSSWRNATGQETLNGNDSSLNVDPQLTNPGAGVSIGLGGDLTLLPGYRLNSASALINAGLNLPALFATSVGTQDFYGGALPVGGAYDVGAHEYAASGSAPQANPGGPFNINEGTTVQLSGANSSGQISKYEWDLNYDGNTFDTDVTGISATLPGSQLDGPSTRTVALRVTGPSGSDTETATINVANVTPTVNAGPDASLTPGMTFTNPGTFADPGPGDGWTATVDYGDGAGPVALTLNTTNKTFSLSHIYNNVGTYGVVVQISDKDGAIGSDSVSVNVTAQQQPASLTSVNIGNVAPTSGTVVVNEGHDYDITAGGNNIWSAADTLRYAYSSRGGDFDVKVRVAGMTNTHAQALAGLMIREGTATNARNAMVWVRPNAGVAFQVRGTTGGTTVIIGSNGVVGGAFPNDWVRLKRVGDTISAYRGSNGTTWTLIGSTTFSAPLPTQMLLGLGVCGRNTTTACTAQFRDLTDLVVAPPDLTPPAAPAALVTTPSQTGIALDWADNAESDLAGYNIYRSSSQNGTYTKLNLNGLLLTSAYNDTAAPAGAQSFYRVTAVDKSNNESQPASTSDTRPAPDLTPPAAPSALVTTPSQSGIALDWADNVDSDLAGYNVYRSSSLNGTYTKLNLNGLLLTSAYNDTAAPAGVASFYRVTAVDQSTNESQPAGTSDTRPVSNDTTPPATPTGLVATGSQSGIALNWADNVDSDLAGYNVYRSDSANGTFTKINLNGLLTSSDFNDTLAPAGVASFYRVTAVDQSSNETTDFATANALRPNPVVQNFTSLNLGKVGTTTTTTTVAGGYDVTSGGANIGAGADAFRYVYQQRTGDFDVKVRVAGMTNTDPLAHAGLMIREALTTNARNAMVYARPDGADTFQARSTAAGGGTANVGSVGPNAFPNDWLRLKRVGNAVSAYRSTDGTTWTLIGTVNFTTALPATVYLGMAVCSHTASTACTAQFRDFGDVT